MKPGLTILCGPTCGGKTTLLKQMAQMGYDPIISYTTRPRRRGEVDRVDYRFVSDRWFEKIVRFNKLIFVREFVVADGSTYRYGVSREELPSTEFMSRLKRKVLILDTEGVVEAVTDTRIDLCPYVIMVDAPLDVILNRAKARGDDLSETWDRYQRESSKFESLIKRGFVDLRIGSVQDLHIP